MYAHITLTNRELTANSTCTIDGQTVPVPRRTEFGGIAFPYRIIAAINFLGYQPMGGDYQRSLHAADDHCTVEVEPS